MPCIKTGSIISSLLSKPELLSPSSRRYCILLGASLTTDNRGFGGLFGHIGGGQRLRHATTCPRMTPRPVRSPPVWVMLIQPNSGPRYGGEVVRLIHATRASFSFYSTRRARSNTRAASLRLVVTRLPPGPRPDCATPKGRWPRPPAEAAQS